MQEAEFRERRNDRSLRYAGRVLPPDKTIGIRLDPTYGAEFSGQVAAIVIVNLLARMTPRLRISVPQREIVSPLPWAGLPLGAKLLEVAYEADPFGTFELRDSGGVDFEFFLGPQKSNATVHGVGWDAYIGRGASPIAARDSANPIGPAFAAVAAAAHLFANNLGPFNGDCLFDLFRWQTGITTRSQAADFMREPDLGNLWTVGTGSVGSAALYFLSLATRNFAAAVFDHDIVKVENLDRSPIFTAQHARDKIPKVYAVGGYLRSIGVAAVIEEPRCLHESEIWRKRSPGKPDIVIAAANENGVRALIENSAPPLQIYGTTGRNWQASVFRHMPGRDACSCCVFPPDQSDVVMTCATGTVTSKEKVEVDAALPFLSFAAGLMAAAEIFKAGLSDYPFTTACTGFYTKPPQPFRFVGFDPARRQACICHDRSASVHKRMVSGTKFEHLAHFV